MEKGGQEDSPIVGQDEGGGRTAPPSSSWNQATLTTMGVLLTSLTVGAMNDAVSTTFGSDYRMPLGPMGALLALQFGLTAAPAAQPRTIIVGQVVSILITLAFAEISSVDAWIKQSLAVVMAVGCMAKIGVVNPPAAANAFVFASGSWGYTNRVVALFGNVVAIMCAVLINNVSDKRQYPSFWGIPPILQCSPSKVSKNHQLDPIESLLRRARARQAKKSAKADQTNDKGRSDPMPVIIEPSVVEDVELGASKIQNDSGHTVVASEYSTDITKSVTTVESGLYSLVTSSQIVRQQSKSRVLLITVTHGFSRLNYCADRPFLSPAVVFELRS